jgi:hypothetical protein
MSYVSTPLRGATTIIVLPIDRRSRFADELPDTLLLVTRHGDDQQASEDIFEYLHEIGAMAVVA